MDSSSSPTNPTPTFKFSTDTPTRTRSFSSMSSTTSSSTSSPTPPSPFFSTSSIPFSWETHPGIPKKSPAKPSTPKPTLPLPPPLKPKRPKSQTRFVRDPFALALMECSKEKVEEEKWEMEEVVGRRRRGRRGVGDRFGFGIGFGLDLYGSCKTTCSVVDSSIRIPRSGRSGLPVYGRINHRPE